MSYNTNVAIPQGGDSLRFGQQAGIDSTHAWRGAQQVLAGGIVAPEFIGFGDDFLGDAINATWSTDTGGGSTALNQQASGVVRLTTGATSGNHFSYALGLHWKPANGLLVFSTRIAQVSAATARAVEVGWSNALSRTSGRTFTVMTLAGVTSAASADAAVFGWDTGGSLTTYHALTAKNAAAQAAAVAGVAPSTAFDYLTVAIDASGNAFFYTGKTPVLKAYITNAVTASSLLTPWVSVTTLSAAAISMDVDYITAVGSRPE